MNKQKRKVMEKKSMTEETEMSGFNEQKEQEKDEKPTELTNQQKEIIGLRLRLQNQEEKRFIENLQIGYHFMMMGNPPEAVALSWKAVIDSSQKDFNAKWFPQPQPKQ